MLYPCMFPPNEEHEQWASLGINHAPLLYYQTAVHKHFPNFVITSGSGSFIIERELSKGKNNLDFITSINQF